MFFLNIFTKPYSDNINESDSIFIGFFVVGENIINNHIRAKVLNLVKNKKEEVVWTIQQDHSFLNLTYELRMQQQPKLEQRYNNLNLNSGKNININQIITQKNISDEDIFTTATGSDLEKTNLSAIKRNKFSEGKFSKKSSKNLFNSTNKNSISDKNNSSADLSKSFHSNKNKNTYDIANFSSQLDSDDKNYDNDSEIDSDECLNINYQLLENNYIYNDTNNIYSKEYLSSLKYEEYEYDTFCQSIIISGIKASKINVLNFTKNFPSSCGHLECSQLCSFSPSILYHYQNKNKLDQIRMTDLIAELIFPFGIKVCFLFDSTHKYPKCEEPIMNIIHNEKGDKYYMVSFIYYKKMNLKKFQERFKINDIKKKFETICQNHLTSEASIFVPESISLISRFPFINQMGQCLKNLISITDNTKINLFVNHIINQVPVPYKNQKIKFYTPINSNPIKLVNPFILNNINFKPDNIFDYFSIDNIVTIFYLSLLEQQLLFIDNDHSLLSSISYLFTNLTYPISWIDTYIPILSLSSISFLQSIAPFIMGSSEYLVNYAINNSYIGEQYSPRVIFIHIRNNIINMQIQNLLIKKKGMSRKNILKFLELPQIPEGLEKTITKRLNSIKVKLNKRKNINYIKEIQNAFCDVMIIILGKYKEYFFIVDDNPVFNKESYIESQKSEERLFYKEFTETQSFIQFLSIEKEEIKKRKNYIHKINSTPTYGRTYDYMYVDHSFFYLRKNKMKNENIPTSANKKGYKSFFKIGKTNETESDIIFDSFSRNKDSDLMDYSGIEEVLKLSNIATKSNKNDNNLRILLMPYFIENLKKNSMDNEQKKNYIQNKMNQMLGLDNEIEKILNVHNLPYYILPSYKRYTFETIIDDNYQRYFIGSLNNNNLHNNSNKYPSNTIKTFSDEIYEEININENLYFKNEDGLMQKKLEYALIDSWFKYISFPNSKTKNINDDEIIALLGNKNYRSYLICMIFQYNLSSEDFLKYIKEESMQKLANVTFNILSKINRDEFIIAKLITCACFDYYTIDKNTKKICLLVDKLKQINKDGNLNCSAWKTYEFWSTWLKDDFKSKENDINNYLDENFGNNSGQKSEYFFISRITRIMYGLGIDKSLIDEVIFQNLAMKFLNQNQIDDLRYDFISSK